MAKHCNFIRLICACLGLIGFPMSACHSQEDFLKALNPNFGQSSQSTGSRFVDTRDAPSRFEGSAQLPPPGWGESSPGRFSSAQVSSRQIASGQISSGQIASGQVASGLISPAVIDYGSAFTSTPYLNSNYGPGRIDAARHAASQYRSQSSFGVPKVAELSATNAELVERWIELAQAVNSISAQVQNAQNRLQAATRDYNDVNSKLQQNQTTLVIGQLLSHKRNQIEDWLVDGSAIHYLNDDLIQSRQKQLESKLLGYDGKDVVRQTNEILAALQIDSNNVNNSGVAAQIQSLLRERSDWLKLLKQGQNDYQQNLGDLDSISSSLGKLISDYRALINRHVIWIRSNDALGIADLQKTQAGISSVFSSRRSLDIGYSLRQKWKSDPASGVILIVSALTILILRSVVKHWLIGIGKRKTLRESNSSVRKCAASLLTLLLAGAFPSVLYLLARWLGSGYVTESTLPISSALYAASLIALAIELPRQLLRRFGFVEKQLQIELPRQQRAAVYLSTIAVGLVLAAYVVTLAGRVDHGAWSGSVARLGFIASMLLVAWTSHLALKLNRGFLEPIVEKFGGTVFLRIRVLFYLLGIGFPLVMIGLSVLGYDFTATEITKRAAIMLASILIGTTLWAAIKILSSSAWHKLTGTRDDRQVDEYSEPATAQVSGALAAHSLELKHQLAFLSQCALVLLAVTSVGWLWIDIFPNVRLGNPVVWTVDGTSTQTFLDANGQTVSRSYSEATPITLLHLVLAAATLFVAFQIAKLLPSIFDALILQRVNFDEAMEHLALMLGRCLLFGIGCFIACRLVGLRWNVIQWLAVGLSIGIGFGLQDVVKNLLGGLIVLFEKPARLGDLITVGSVTGRVAAQKLRTTTLSDEDGREVIVPNKNFMSQKVVNWLGAGRLKAIPIEVTVTRDQRPVDVCRMLQHLMVEQPELLLSPAPQATLVCVGQQSQRIGLLAWIEEDQDAAKYREKLLKMVLEFLSEKNLLAPHQPRQPLLDGSTAQSAHRNLDSNKRRSA